MRHTNSSSTSDISAGNGKYSSLSRSNHENEWSSGGLDGASRTRHGGDAAGMAASCSQIPRHPSTPSSGPSLAPEYSIPDGCCPTCGLRLFKLVDESAKSKKTLPLAPWLFKMGRRKGADDGLSESPHHGSGSSNFVPEETAAAQNASGNQLTAEFDGGSHAPRYKVIPLNIPGYVKDGQCLECEKRHEQKEQELLLGSSATSLLVEQELGLHVGNTSSSVMYIGDYNVHGLPHGPGELIWNTGDRYVGNFFHGNRDGQGTMFLRDGSEYSGEWECNLMHGTGTRSFSNGDVYTGSFVNGQRCGFGKLFFKNGDLYAGHWENDRFHGFGKLFVQVGGAALEGHFRCGQKEGKFKWQHPSGKLDILRYENDLLVGPGVRWSADRKKTWLLQVNQKNSSPTSSSPTYCSSPGKKKKRITIAEAVSIGYNCEQGERQQVGISEADNIVLWTRPRRRRLRGPSASPRSSNSPPTITGRNVSAPRSPVRSMEARFRRGRMD